MSSELARAAKPAASGRRRQFLPNRGVIVYGCGCGGLRRAPADSAAALEVSRPQAGPAAAPSAPAARPLHGDAPAATAAAPGSIFADRSLCREGPARDSRRRIRAGVQVRAAIDQQLDGGRVSLIGGPHQRRRPAQRFLRVDLRRRDRAAPSSPPRCRCATPSSARVSPRGSRSFGSAPAFSRLSMMAAFAVQAGQRERREALAVGDLRIRARLKQQVRRGQVRPVHRPVQRRRAVGLRARSHRPSAPAARARPPCRRA